MKITKTALAGVAATGALALAAVPVLAQDATDDSSTTESPTGEATDESSDAASTEGRHQGGGFRGELAQRLADELGLEAADVEAALDAVREDWVQEHAAEREERREQMRATRDAALDEAVADGAITQDQADVLTELWDARDGAAEGLRPSDLTDEQRAALEAFRDEAGELVEGHERRGHHGPRGMEPGGPSDEAAPGASPDEGAPRDADDDTDSDAEVQESGFALTT